VFSCNLRASEDWLGLQRRERHQIASERSSVDAQTASGPPSSTAQKRPVLFTSYQKTAAATNCCCQSPVHTPPQLPPQSQDPLIIINHHPRHHYCLPPFPSSLFLHSINPTPLLPPIAIPSSLPSTPASPLLSRPPRMTDGASPSISTYSALAPSSFGALPTSRQSSGTSAPVVRPTIFIAALPHSNLSLSAHASPPVNPTCWGLPSIQLIKLTCRYLI
jgi:hypothetical protein